MSMDEIYLIVGMTAVTFGIRYIMIPMSGRIRLSPAFEKALGYSPPVVLTAIIVPAVLMPAGDGLQLSFANAYLVGAVVTAAIGYATRNLLATIVLGMGAFFLWQWAVQCGALSGLG